ncbi:MAG TPA: hypothetical protein VIP29_00745 [Nitrososphaeraceae archaeon]
MKKNLEKIVITSLISIMIRGYPGGFNPEDVITNICEGLIDKIKNQTGTLPENQSSTSATG